MLPLPELVEALRKAADYDEFTYYDQELAKQIGRIPATATGAARVQLESLAKVIAGEEVRARRLSLQAISEHYLYDAKAEARKSVKGPFKAYIGCLVGNARNADYAVPLDLYPDFRDSLEKVRETREQFKEALPR